MTHIIPQENRQSMAGGWLKICPRCRGLFVFRRVSRRPDETVASREFYCRRCGYRESDCPSVAEEMKRLY